jgi:hypothetical protein
MRDLDHPIFASAKNTDTFVVFALTDILVDGVATKSTLAPFEPSS